MIDNKQIMCDECKMNVPINDVRYVVKGNSNLRMCSQCRDRTPNRSRRQELSSKKIEIKLVPEKEQVKKEVKKEYSPMQKSGKRDYMCTRCKYKFKYDPSGDNKFRCPYCSSPAYVTSIKSLSSGKLFSEINDFD